MRRRNFLKVTSGLFVPLAFPAILHAAIPPVRRRRFFRAPPAGGGGGGAWTDIIDQASTANDGSTTTDALDWNQVNVVTGGSCTKARIYINGTSSGTFNIKMGLFALAGGTVLANGTGTFDGAQHAYTEITWGTPVTVANSTSYLIAWIMDNNIANLRWSGGPPTGHWYEKLSFGYSGFNSSSTLPTPDFNDFDRRYAASIWIQ